MNERFKENIKMMKFVILAFLLALNGSYLFGADAKQSIRGIVLDAGLGSPVPGATIKMISLEPNLGAISNAEGEFVIKNVPVGRHSILTKMMSYKPQKIDNIMVISGKETYLEIKLVDNPTVLGEIEISGYNHQKYSRNDFAVTSSTLLKPEAINRYAGSRNDPSKTAANSAGVTSNNSMRNDIIIRGNSPLGVLWRIDGADVPSPNHFMESGAGGGIFGILNNNLLASSDFMSGAFPTEYGGKTAGVFDIKLRNGNNNEYEQTFQLGMNGLEFGSEGPFSSSGRASYLANFRFVSLRPFKAIGLDINTDVIPEYFDGTIKINVPTKDFGRFSFWAIGGNSGMNVKDSEEEDIEWDETTEKEDFELSSDLYAAGFNHTLFYGKNTFGELILSSSGSFMSTKTDIVAIDSSWLDSHYSGSEGSLMARYQITHKASVKNLFKAGISVKRNHFSLTYKSVNDDGILEEKLNDDGDAYLYQSYIHWQYRPGELFEFNTGLHYQLFALNDSYSIEPRFSALFRMSKNHNISLAYGLHSQAHPLMHYFFKFFGAEGARQPNLKLDMMKSHHIVLGYQNTMIEDIYIKAEAYAQYLYDVPVSIKKGKEYLSLINLGAEFGMDIIDSLANKGTGLNYGIELTVNKSFKNGYYLMFTGCLFRSKYEDALGVERSTTFDMGHIANLLGGVEYELSDDKKYIFTANFKITSTGGRRGIPIDIEKSIIEGDKVKDLSRAYEYDYGSFFQADIKLGLLINLESTTHDISFAIDNVTNHKNIFRESWDEENNELERKYQLGLLPYLYYRINF